MRDLAAHPSIQGSLIVLALAITLSAWTAIVAIVSLWALCEPRVRPLLRWVRRALRRPVQTLAPIAGDAGAVLIIRPCAGRDQSLERNLRSLLDARRGERAIECVFAVGDAGDAAYESALSAAQWLSAHEIKSSVQLTGAIGPNHKVDQLGRVLHGRAPSIVLVADSDVDLTGVALDALIEPVARGESAACWASVAERSEATLGDRASLAILAGGLHGFALLSRLDPGGMVGKLFAVRADALENVGGFSSMLRYLGEDVELSRRLRARGLAVSSVELGVCSSAAGRSLAAARDRYARWMLVVRTQRTALMASYPALFFAAPLQALLSLALIGRYPAVALAVFATAVLARLMVAAGARSAARLPRSVRATVIDPWLGDVVLLFAWARALRMREVRWRGGLLRFDHAGLLEPR